jgi:hypothetical protein
MLTRDCSEQFKQLQAGHSAVKQLLDGGAFH